MPLLMKSASIRYEGTHWTAFWYMTSATTDSLASDPGRSFPHGYGLTRLCSGPTEITGRYVHLWYWTVWTDSIVSSFRQNAILQFFTPNVIEGICREPAEIFLALAGRLFSAAPALPALAFELLFEGFCLFAVWPVRLFRLGCRLQGWVFRNLIKDGTHDPGSLLAPAAEQVSGAHPELVGQLPVLAQEFFVLLFKGGIFVFDLLELAGHLGGSAAGNLQSGIFLGAFFYETTKREDQFLPAHGVEPAVQFLQFRPHPDPSGLCRPVHADIPALGQVPVDLCERIPQTADLLLESGDLEILPVNRECKLPDPVLAVLVQFRELGRYIRRCARCRLWLAAPLSGGDDLPGLRIVFSPRPSS